VTLSDLAKYSMTRSVA